MDPNEQNTQTTEEKTEQQNKEETVHSEEHINNFFATFLQLVDELSAKSIDGTEMPSCSSFIKPMANNLLEKIEEAIATDPNMVVILYYFSQEVREKLMTRITEMQKAYKEKKKSLQDVQSKLAMLLLKIQESVQEVKNLIESLKEGTSLSNEEREPVSKRMKLEPDDLDD